MNRLSTVLLMAAMLPFLAFSDEWFVDLNASPGGDGLSEATAFRSIQEAIDCEDVDDGDVITVLPGVYDQGWAVDDDGLTNRVLVTKSLTIRARDGRRVTSIVGAQTSKANRLGSNAIRCIGVTKPDVEIIGFTIASGATFDGTDQPKTSGGGVYFYAAATGGYVVDCAVTNCCSTRGGGIRNAAAAVRTFFSANMASGNGSAIRDAAAYHCVFVHHNTSPIYGKKDVVNCTFALNYLISGKRGEIFDTECGDGVKIYNSAVLGPASPLTTTGKAYDCVLAADVTAGIEPENTVTDVAQHQLMAPAFLDFRPQSTGALPAAGNAEWLSLVPEKYRFTDFDGRAFSADADGRVAAGAVQRTGTPATGRLEFKDSGIVMDGHPTVDNVRDYAYGEVFPTQFVVRAVAPAGKQVFGLNHSIGRMRFPLLDGRYVLMPPESPDDNYAVSRATAAVVLYVDADVESSGDGSADAPYATIQEAVNATPDDTYGVVHVAPGVYDKGETLGLGVSNRVYIANKCLRITATGPRDETVIEGAYGSGSNGYGTEAVRCVAINNCKSVVQGFTLRKGRVVKDTGTNEGCCGGYFGTQSVGSYAQLLDCVVTDCYGSRGVVGGGYIARCEIKNCQATVNGLVRFSQMASCLCVNNIAYGAFFTDEGKYYHVTAVGTGSYVLFSANTGLLYANGVYSGFTSANEGSTFVGDLVWDVDVLPEIDGVTTADPVFADAANGNYRLRSTSPALGLGAAAGVTDYALHATADLDGRILRLTDGRPSAGCYQYPVFVCTADASGPLAGSAGISPSGTLIYKDGDTVVFTATDAESRDLIGFEVGGVTQKVAGVTYTHVFSDSDGDIVIRALYRRDRYVSPDGDDTASGVDAEHPLQSLAVAVAGLQPGDTLHAAPGTYDIGSDLHATQVLGSAAPTIRSRVVIPQGVSLVSSAGASKTFIVGKKGPSDYGLSADSFRCVMMESGSRLEGFTVCGGATSPSGSTDDAIAGGILCRDETPLVVDCVISNNVATRGGAGFQGTYVNCRVLNNRATVNGAALRGGDARRLKMYGCLFDDNWGSNLFYTFTEMRGCTIGRNNHVNKDGVTYFTDVHYTDCPVYDSLVLPLYPPASGMNLTRCAWPADIVWPDGTVSNDCVTGTLEELSVDEDGVPVFGANIGIDRASADAWPVEICGTRDLNGSPRVMNGAMDIGACEYDYRERYLHALGLGTRRGRIDTVSAEVYENSEGRLFLPSGSVGLTLSSSGKSNTFCSADFTVTGSGVLTVTVDGVARSYTAADGTSSITWKMTGMASAVAFSYAPGEADEGGALLLGVAVYGEGMTIILR